MIPQHSSSQHLLCFMFHPLGRETVKQAPCRKSHQISLPEEHKPCVSCNGYEERLDD